MSRLVNKRVSTQATRSLTSIRSGLLSLSRFSSCEHFLAAATGLNKSPIFVGTRVFTEGPCGIQGNLEVGCADVLPRCNSGAGGCLNSRI